MADRHSITHWIHQFRGGDHTAADPLWERYFTRLEALAGKLLRGQRPGGNEAEDIALSALGSLFRGLDRGQFPLLHDRNDLWRLLAVIAGRKVAHAVRHETCQRRGGQACTCGGGFEPPDLREIVGREPTPDLTAQVAEELQRLLALLPRADLRETALHKLEGMTNQEIAAKLGCACRTVDRKLRLIRRLWEGQAVP
jgi:DNA-directed RNA polymerase specialized sigma24 family protein